MLISKTDADLLEFLALSEPWSMVCGEFCPRYGSIEELVARLITFEHAEYLTIEPNALSTINSRKESSLGVSPEVNHKLPMPSIRT